MGQRGPAINNIIFNPTIPQSGTWFVLRFFEKLGFKIEHTGEIMKRVDNRVIDIDKPTILNAHIFPFYYTPSPYKESWPSFGGDPIQELIVRRNKTSIGCIKLLASMYKTVIPMRDPLAALLTREARAPNLRHFYIVDAYVEVARELADHPNVKFLPVDLYTTFEDRQRLLNEVVEHCGLDVNQHSAVVDELAGTWGRENVTPNNKYHKPYDEGDIGKIEELLGPKWAEVVHLKNMGGILVPFLSSVGYTEKLW